MIQKQKHSVFRLFACCFVMLFFVSKSVCAKEMAADQFVENFSQSVLDEIKARKQELIKNPEKLDALVDEMVMPNVNFRKMTQLVVGRPWRQATTDQREEIIRQFRMLLVKTYSGALSELNDQTIEIDRLRARPDDKDVIVTSRVIQKSGPPIELAYRVEKQEEGWRVYDLSVLGLWLIDSYRNQFRPLLNSSGIDGLIVALQNKNK